jgi:hypothetical protein
VAQVPKITKPVLAARTRRLESVKAIFRSGPSKPDPTIHIDLTEGYSAMHVGTATRGGATTRGGPTIRGGPNPNRGAGTSGVTADAATKMKGKRVVAIVEKAIEIVVVKRRRMKPNWKH